MPEAEPFDAHATRKLLSRLGNVLERHLKLEDTQLYPELQRSPDAQIRETAIRYQQEMGGLRVAFEKFCDRWPGAAAIAQEPAEFLRQLAAIRDPLVKRIEAEDTGLYEYAQTHFDEQMRRARL